MWRTIVTISRWKRTEILTVLQARSDQAPRDGRSLKPSDGRDEFADQGRVCNTIHPPPKTKNKHKFQHDIHAIEQQLQKQSRPLSLKAKQHAQGSEVAQPIGAPQRRI